MTIEKAISHLENMKWLKGYDNTEVGGVPLDLVIENIISLLKAQSEEITALRRLVEWSEECGFGLDNIFWEDYVKPEELEGKDYIEQLIYVAKKAGECDD